MPKKDKKEINRAEAGGNLHIEIDKIYGGISVLVSNVFSILDFNDTTALLKLKKGRVRVCGCGLSVSVYENRTVEICGKLEEILFV